MNALIHEYMNTKDCRDVPKDVIFPRIEYHSILQLSTQDSFVIEVDENCTAFLNEYLATDRHHQIPYISTRSSMY